MIGMAQYDLWCSPSVTNCTLKSIGITTCSHMGWLTSLKWNSRMAWLSPFMTESDWVEWEWSHSLVCLVRPCLLRPTKAGSIALWQRPDGVVILLFEPVHSMLFTKVNLPKWTGCMAYNLLYVMQYSEKENIWTFNVHLIKCTFNIHLIKNVDWKYRNWSGDAKEKPMFDRCRNGSW